jgi:hypothetical protein
VDIHGYTTDPTRFESPWLKPDERKRRRIPPDDLPLRSEAARHAAAVKASEKDGGGFEIRLRPRKGI